MDQQKVDILKQMIVDELNTKSPGERVLLNTIYPKVQKIDDVTKALHKALDELIREGTIEFWRGMTLWQGTHL